MLSSGNRARRNQIMHAEIGVLVLYLHDWENAGKMIRFRSKMRLSSHLEGFLTNQLQYMFQ